MINTLSPAWPIDIPATSRLSTRAALIELFDAMVAVRSCLDIHEEDCPGAVSMLQTWAGARDLVVVSEQRTSAIVGEFTSHRVQLAPGHRICVYRQGQL